MLIYIDNVEALLDCIPSKSYLKYNFDYLLINFNTKTTYRKRILFNVLKSLGYELEYIYYLDSSDYFSKNEVLSISINNNSFFLTTEYYNYTDDARYIGLSLTTFLDYNDYCLLFLS